MIRKIQEVQKVCVYANCAIHRARQYFPLKIVLSDGSNGTQTCHALQIRKLPEQLNVAHPVRSMHVFIVPIFS